MSYGLRSEVVEDMKRSAIVDTSTWWWDEHSNAKSNFDYVGAQTIYEVLGTYKLR